MTDYQLPIEAGRTLHISTSQVYQLVFDHVLDGHVGADGDIWVSTESITRYQTRSTALTDEEKTPYQLGFEDGLASPDELSVGRTWAEGDPFFGRQDRDPNESYDRGVNDGRYSAKRKQQTYRVEVRFDVIGTRRQAEDLIADALHALRHTPGVTGPKVTKILNKEQEEVHL